MRGLALGIRHASAELALDKDGKFLEMRVRTSANLGAYLSTFASCIPTILYATLLAGQYRTPHIYCEVTALFTNTTPVDAYRGAGRPEATYVVERLVETAAREMKMSPVEIRKQNFIREFPYQTPVALCYDTGNYEATLDAALQLADVKNFESRKAQSLNNGKLRGIGYACYIEACGIAPSNVAGSLGARAGLFEAGEIRVHPTGTVTVFTGSHSHGQGHETSFAQVVADRLGLPIEAVEVVHGDTSKILFGMGTYGSRSIAVGGTAIVKALDKIVAKGKKIAAHLLEASESDIEYDRGQFKVAGTDRKKTFGEVAFAAYVPHNYPLDKLEPGLNENAFYDPTNFTFPAGSYVCEVEVDSDTGRATIERYLTEARFAVARGEADGVAIAGHVQGERLHPADAPVRSGVAVDGDEQIAPGLVGDAGAILQADEAVVVAREDHLQAAVGQEIRDPAGHGERHVFFARSFPADRPGVVATVPGVDHHAANLEPELLGQRDVADDDQGRVIGLEPRAVETREVLARHARHGLLGARAGERVAVRVIRAVEQLREDAQRHLHRLHLLPLNPREPLALPQLKILRKPDSIFDYRYEDFELAGYQSHAAIKAPVAV